MVPCNSQLAPISFVGGATKTLGFRIFNRGGSPIDVSNCTARFAIIDAVNKYGKPILVKEMSPYPSSDTGNILSVNLASSDTVDLFGKYLYQISIVDKDGSAEDPQQGDFYIFNNIDKDYLK